MPKKLVQMGNSLVYFNAIDAVLDQLENKVYELDITESDVGTSIRFQENAPFTFKDKVYNHEKPFIDHVLFTWENTKGNMGIILEGVKGLGKTVTAKQICNEIGLPVIFLNKKVRRDSNLGAILSNIDQDLIVFVDEFDKLFESYDDGDFHTQDSFLSLTDGIANSNYRRLFIFTCNKEVNDKFTNRPTRARYYKQYNYLNEDLYNAIIDDKLVNKAFEEDLKKNLPVTEANIDTLISVIQEINIHNKPFSNFKEFFNIRTDLNKYEVMILDETRKEVLLGTISTMSSIRRTTTHIKDIGHVSYLGNTTEGGLRFKVLNKIEGPLNTYYCIEANEEIIIRDVWDSLFKNNSSLTNAYVSPNT